MPPPEDTDHAVSGERGSEDPVSVLQAVYPALVRVAGGLAPRGYELDLVHDTLVEVLVRHPNFRGLDYPKAYSLVVLTRLAHARRARRVRERAVSRDITDLLESPAPQEEIAAAIDRIAIGRALMTLGRGQRTCVYLRFLVGLDDAMIGELLGCSRVTVRTQIARGLRKLRSVLQDGSLEGGEAR